MNIEFAGRNFELGEKIQAFTEEKLDKVVRFLDEPIEVRVILELKKRRHIAEIHLSHRHGVLQATEDTVTIYDAVSQAADKIEKQARRSRKKFMDKRRRADRSLHEQLRWPVDVLARESVAATAEKKEGPRVIKSTHLPIKPMTIDEAALSLESSKNDFFVFRDSATERVSVLYKRRDDHYGLIVPEF